MSNPWFRVYAETVDNAKLRTLAFEDRWHYIAVLCCKAQGILDSSEPDILDRIVGVKLNLDASGGDSALVKAKQRLMAIRLIDENWQPTGWDERQFTSDSSRERTRKWRERQTSPTPPPDTEKDSEQNRTERDVTGDVTVTSLRPRSATRLPEDFGVTPEREAYAVKSLPRVDVPALMEAFRDHWTAASGAKARKVDWDATWRTWVRNANQFGYPMVTAADAKPVAQIRFDANGRQVSG